MKTLITQLVCLLAITVAVGCGRRTAPVPYDLAEVTLPKIIVQKPIYKGDWLSLSWSLDASTGDVSADMFVLKAFEQTENCKYCQNKIIETFKIPTHSTSLGDSLYFIKEGRDYSFYISKKIHDRWIDKGLVYFEISYQTSSGLSSEASEKAWPKPTNAIVTPEVIIINTSVDQSTGDKTIVIRWKHIPERLYRSINQQGFGREITQYFGVNLYRVKDKRNLFKAIKVNDLPLLSGQAKVQIDKSVLLACHVDRFGNESKKIMVVDNSTDSPMQNGKQ